MPGGNGSCSVPCGREGVEAVDLFLTLTGRGGEFKGADNVDSGQLTVMHAPRGDFLLTYIMYQKGGSDNLKPLKKLILILGFS